MESEKRPTPQQAAPNNSASNGTGIESVCSNPAEWLAWLYGEKPHGLIWIGGDRDGWKGRTFSTIEAAAEYAAELDAAGGKGVYHRLTTLARVPEKRGKAEDSAACVALAMDLDLAGPNHKADGYPETDADLSNLLDKAGLPEPSAWVHSGGGRYPYWRLAEPVDLTEPGALDWAQHVSARLHEHVIAWGKHLGWKVDNTRDLARVYRLPGTTNRKNGGSVPCRVLTTDGPALTLADLESALLTAPKVPAPEVPAAPDVAAPLALERPAGTARTFTEEQARDFCRPHLEALRAAQDGEINPRLNDAAKVLSHFIPEFWSAEQAEGWLLAALEHTEYDGRTWKAGDTIRSAFRSAGGDWRAERTTLDVFGQGDQAPAAPGWTADDLTDVLSGKRVRVVPELARRQDGVALLYRGKEHAVAGEPESGKTWFALMCARDVLLSGGRVLYVDFEDDAATVVGRLLDLGVIADRLRPASGQFRYVRPEGAPRPGDVLSLLTFPDGPADLLVYDGWTEGAALMGQDIMSQDDIAKWRQALVKPALTLGTATLTTDHVVKDREARGRYSIGAQHKLAGLTGVMFTMEVTETWGRGSKGRSKVLITKDRNGGLRPHGKADKANLTHIGDLVGDATSGEMASLILWPPFEDEDETDDTNPVPSHLRKAVAAVLRVLESRTEPMSTKAIEDRAGVRAADVGRALAWLEDSGRVAVERGPRNARLHRLAPEPIGQDGQEEQPG